MKNFSAVFIVYFGLCEVCAQRCCYIDGYQFQALSEEFSTPCLAPVSASASASLILAVFELQFHSPDLFMRQYYGPGGISGHKKAERGQSVVVTWEHTELATLLLDALQGDIADIFLQTLHTDTHIFRRTNGLAVSIHP